MKYLYKRLGLALFTLWVVISFGFVIIRFMPGGPMDYLYSQLLEQGANPKRAERMAELYLNINPNTPLWVQYLDYMSSVLLHGNFGTSIWFNMPVEKIVFAALPWSVFIMLTSILLSFVIGISLGGMMALYESSRFDISATVITLFGNSIPFYIVALILLLVFAYNLNWFPTSGRYPTGVTPGPNLSFVLGVFYHATLPVASMVAGKIGGRAISMRANAISIVGKDYVRVARLRGLPDSRISIRYITHNAILPMYTSLLIGIGTIFGGAVILEQMFRYPGVGFYFYKAVQARDYPLLMGSFVLTTVTILVGILIADMTYGLIDPRINAGGDSNVQ